MQCYPLNSAKQFATARSLAKRYFALGLMAILFLASPVLLAGDLDPCPTVKYLAAPSRFQAGCGTGKSKCPPDGNLDFKALPTTPPKDSKNLIQSVCISGFQPEQNKWVKLWERAYNDDALVLPIAPLLNEWLRDPDKAALLRQAPSADLDFKVSIIWSDGPEGKAKYEQEWQLALDLKSLWVDRKLRPVIQPFAGALKLDGNITLDVAQLKTWSEATNTPPKTVALTIAGIKVPLAEPSVLLATAQNTLTYELRKTAEKPDNKLEWERVLNGVLNTNPKVKIALADDKGVLTEPLEVQFAVPPTEERRSFAFAFAFLLAVIFIFFGLASDWTWIRDSYDIPQEVLGMNTRTFSLGRVQMFFWTFVVVLSWIMIWHATGEWQNFGGSALVLMGISVGTAAGAIVVTPPEIIALVAAYKTAKAKSVAPPANPAAAAAAATTAATTAATAAATAAIPPVDTVETAVAKIKAEVGLVSNGFFKDLLSNYAEEGVGLHRLQTMLFTLAFGGAFLVQAWGRASMPTFSPEILALMGISAATYVGFKKV